MSDEPDPPEDKPKKTSKLPLILGVLLALCGGGGGFYVVYSGMIGGDESDPATATEKADAPMPVIGALPDVAYIPIEPLVVSLGDGTSGKHLRFRAQLEVASAYQAEVEAVMPRVVDVLNSYLRALEMRDLTDRAAIVRLRAQMLRRVQIVTGGERVNDLLVMEFVLN